METNFTRTAHQQAPNHSVQNSQQFAGHSAAKTSPKLIVVNSTDMLSIEQLLELRHSGDLLVIPDPAIPPSPHGQWSLGAMLLLRDLGFRKVIISRGNRGCLAFVDGVWAEHSGFKVDAAMDDRAYAFFKAGIIEGLARGLPLQQVIDIAVAAATMQSQGWMTAGVTLNDILHFSATTPRRSRLPEKIRSNSWLIDIREKSVQFIQDWLTKIRANSWLSNPIRRMKWQA